MKIAYFLALILVITINSAHATVVTENWTGTVTVTNSVPGGISVGDTVQWSVTYDNSSTQRWAYNDGVDGISQQGLGDDVKLPSTYLANAGEFLSDAIFDFSQISSAIEDAFVVGETWNDRRDAGGNYVAGIIGSSPYKYQLTRDEFKWITDSIHGFRAFIYAVNNGRPYQMNLAIRDATFSIDTGGGNGGGTIPEPATLALLSLGLVGIGYRRKKALI